MKTVFILLTKHDDVMAKAFNFFTLTEYSHAAIGLEENPEHFFSFVTKGGFYLERPFQSKKPHKQARHCALYRVEVSDRVYRNIKRSIKRFTKNQQHYRYNFLGLVLAGFNISLARKQHFFCSQFVSKVLQRSGAIKFVKSTDVYLPDDFQYECDLKLCYRGNIGGLNRQTLFSFSQEQAMLQQV